MTTYPDYPPPLYPRLPSAPPDDHKVAPPRPAYPPGGSPRYPPPGMHRAGPVTGAVSVLPTNYNRDGKPELPPKQHVPKQSEVVVQPKVIVLTQVAKEKNRHSGSSSDLDIDQQIKSAKTNRQESDGKNTTSRVKTSDPPCTQSAENDDIVPNQPNKKVQKLRKRNYVFMALAGISFLLCLNVVFGAIALVFAILAEMDLGNGKVKSGSAKSVVSIVLTIVGVFIAAILLTVFLVVHS